MRRKFANICSDLITRDDKSVVMLGDISHFLLRETEQKAPAKPPYNADDLIPIGADIELQAMFRP